MATDQAPLIVEKACSGVFPRTLAQPHRFTVVLGFLAIYLIWGSTYLAIRYAVETIPPLYTAGMRHLAAGSILLLWCRAERLRPTWAQIRASIVIGVFFFLIGHGSLHWAEQKVPSGLASLDRKSTRLNSSHGYISYAVFCLKKNTPALCTTPNT